MNQKNSRVYKKGGLHSQFFPTSFLHSPDFFQWSETSYGLKFRRVFECNYFSLGFLSFCSRLSVASIRP